MEVRAEAHSSNQFRRLTKQTAERCFKHYQRLPEPLSNPGRRPRTGNAALIRNQSGVHQEQGTCNRSIDKLPHLPRQVKEFIPSAWASRVSSDGKSLIVPADRARRLSIAVERAKAGPLWSMTGAGEDGLSPLVAAVAARDRWTFSYGCPDCDGRHRHSLRASDLMPKVDGRQVRETTRRNHCPKHILPYSLGPIVHLLVLPEAGR